MHEITMRKKPIIKPTGIFSEKDKKEFSKFYKKNVNKVFRYLFARTGNQADAEDLTAKVFLALLASLDNMSEISNLQAWMFTIARNKLVDHFRSNSRIVGGLESAELICAADNPVEEFHHSQNKELLGKLIRQLNEEQQELLSLRFAGELSYAQIGDLLGKSEAAVKMAVYRLVKNLQKQMEEYHD